MRLLLLPLSIIFSSLMLSSCNKENHHCKGISEATSNNLSDISLLTAHTAFADTLAAHPQLKAFRIINDEHTLGMHCNVYYQGLQVISDGYNLFQSKSTNEMFSIHDHIVDEINLSLIPSITHLQAIDIAREQTPFKRKCASYQLAIFDINATKGNQPREYKLVWNITVQNSGINVVVDAHTQEVYRNFDGKYN